MRRVTVPHGSARRGAAELSDPALAHLFGPGTTPLGFEVETPAPPADGPAAMPASKWLAWTLPTQFLAADETVLCLEDGGAFQIREVPREVPDDLDFEISVEEEAADPGSPETRALMNLDDYPAEFEADLAVFEGISGTTKGGPVEPRA